jgi:hypothetical protein
VHCRLYSTTDQLTLETTCTSTESSTTSGCSLTATTSTTLTSSNCPRTAPYSPPWNGYTAALPSPGDPNFGVYTMTHGTYSTTPTSGGGGPTKPSSTAQPAAATPWSLYLYSGAGSTGNYYILTGNDLQTTSNPCTVIRSVSDAPGANPWCRWYTGGGATYGPCSGGTLTAPQSWRIRAGGCTVYDNPQCQPNGRENAYTAWGSKEGVYERDKWAPPEFVAVRCGGFSS